MHGLSRAFALLTLASALLAGAVAVAVAGEASSESAPPASGGGGGGRARAKPGPGPVFVLRLADDEGDGAISSWNLAYMKRCLERARREQASLFLVEITTDGGRVDITEQMSILLTDFKAARTAIFIKEKAFSAGALVALSCDDIYIKPGSTIGSALPIYVSKDGVKVAEKMVRALTVFFREVAKKKGHPQALAAAMVDPDIEVLEVSDGKKTWLVTREGFEKLVKKTGDRRLVETVRSPVIKKGKILDFGAEECLTYGLAVAAPVDRKALLQHAGLADRQVIELLPTWANRLARFCSSGVIVAVLILIAAMALYTEMHKPTGIGAAVFMAALATFFWANYLAGSAGPVSIVIFLIGLALVLVEIFFIPGFTVAGISGIVLMLVGMAAARIPPGFFTPAKGIDFPSLRWTDLALGVFPVIMGVGASAVGVLVMMRFLPELPIFKRLVLKADMGGAVVTAAQAAGAESVESLVGLSGVAATKLRPGGSARFGERLLDVVSDGEFLEAGAPVKIVSASGNRVVVRRA